MPSVTIHARRYHNYNATVQMVIWDCPECGIVYGVPKDFADHCRDNGERYYCPNGHSLGWDETEADRERKRARAAEQRAEMAERVARQERMAKINAQRSAAAYKGHLTRARNRIANGVCPVPGCKRSGFTQVMRHLSTQHPDWLADHPELNT